MDRSGQPVMAASIFDLTGCRSARTKDMMSSKSLCATGGKPFPLIFILSYPAQKMRHSFVTLNYPSGQGKLTVCFVNFPHRFPYCLMRD
jgi:hypothetical protein